MQEFEILNDEVGEQNMLSMVEEKIDAIGGLCRRFGVVKLDLFGSATSDAFDDLRSDLDFAVSFAACSSQEHYENYFGLMIGTSFRTRWIGRILGFANSFITNLEAVRKLLCRMTPKIPARYADSAGFFRRSPVIKL